MHTGARVTLLSHSAYTGTFEAHLCLETSRQRFCSGAVPESHDRPSACETLVEGRLISGGRRRTQPSAPNSDAPASRPAKPDRKNASSLLTSPPASVGCGWSFSAIVFCLQRLPPVAGAGLDGAASLQPARRLPSWSAQLAGLTAPGRCSRSCLYRPWSAGCTPRGRRRK